MTELPRRPYDTAAAAERRAGTAAAIPRTLRTSTTCTGVPSGLVLAELKRRLTVLLTHETWSVVPVSPWRMFGPRVPATSSVPRGLSREATDEPPGYLLCPLRSGPRQSAEIASRADVNNSYSRHCGSALFGMPPSICSSVATICSTEAVASSQRRAPPPLPRRKLAEILTFNLDRFCGSDAPAPVACSAQRCITMQH
jgi:hypothetical protein